MLHGYTDKEIWQSKYIDVTNIFDEYSAIEEECSCYFSDWNLRITVESDYSLDGELITPQSVLIERINAEKKIKWKKQLAECSKCPSEYYCDYIGRICM